MRCVTFVVQTGKMKIDLTNQLSIKTDDQRRRNIQTFFMTGETNRFLNAKDKLMPTILQLNTVGTAQ